MTHLDTLIATSLGRPQRNIHGDLGPRCPVCSGLGAFFQMGGETGITRSTSRCRCEGSGLDLDGIERMDRERLWQQIHAIESKIGLPLTSRYDYPNLTMSRQYWMECIAWATASGTSVNTSTTETIVFPNVTVPANYMQDGRAIRMRVNGQHSTLGSGTVTVLWGVRWGGVAGTVICKSAAMTQLISLTAAYWDLDVVLQTRSNGSTGTVMGNGLARVFGATAPTIGSATGAPAIGPMTSGGQITPAIATLDLTADTSLSITVTMGASSASNIVIGNQYTLESLN